MQIPIATLCDAAADYQGKMVIMGTFDSILSREFPTEFRQCSLALRISATKEESGEHRLAIRFLREDGTEIIKPMETRIEVNLPEGGTPFITRNLILPLNGLEIPSSGLYRIEISLDGETSAALSFAAVQVQETEDAS